MLNRWKAAAALAAWLSVCGPALAGNGGGPVAAVNDRASAEIDAIHPAMVQRARGLGLPAYVLEVRRDAAKTPVFVVSLTALAGLVPA